MIALTGSSALGLGCGFVAILFVIALIVMAGRSNPPDHWCGATSRRGDICDLLPGHAGDHEGHYLDACGNYCRWSSASTGRRLR